MDQTKRVSGHLIGYARVSTPEQSLDLQVDALRQAGCSKIFTDVVGGARADRPGLEQALEYLRPGDILVTWKLDRLGRSLQHLIHLITDLQRREVGFRSLQESIDTTSPGGKLIFHVMGALAEFERDLIRERTRAGLAAARARGRKGGRPVSMGEREKRLAEQLLQDPALSVAEVARALGVGRSTLYRHVDVASIRPRRESEVAR